MTLRSGDLWDRVLVCDLDGTLVIDGKPTVGLDSLHSILEAHRDRIRVVYATGRSCESVCSLVSDGVLPEPDAIVSSVGTAVWISDLQVSDGGYSEHIQQGWNRDSALAVADMFPEIRLQPDRFQSGVKASFFLDDERVAQSFESRLRAEDIGARVIYSGNRFLDVLPWRAGKRNAVEYVIGQWRLRNPLVMACGDSLNDLDMIDHTRFLGVIVGNAEPALKSRVCEPLVHKAVLPFANGVLEGGYAFGFWPDLENLHEKDGVRMASDALPWPNIETVRW